MPFVAPLGCPLWFRKDALWKISGPCVLWVLDECSLWLLWDAQVWLLKDALAIRRPAEFFNSSFPAASEPAVSVWFDYVDVRHNFARSEDRGKVLGRGSVRWTAASRELSGAEDMKPSAYSVSDCVCLFFYLPEGLWDSPNFSLAPCLCCAGQGKLGTRSAKAPAG